MANDPITQKFSRCSTCGGLIEAGKLMEHIRSEEHEEKLRKLLDSPLTLPDPRREGDPKEGNRRKKKGQ